VTTCEPALAFRAAITFVRVIASRAFSRHRVVATAMDADRGELVDLTRRLVSIPSHEDETAAGDAIEAWLSEETAADVTRDDHGNVLARRGGGRRTDGGGDATELALVGHHDVVPPDESQVGADGYVVEERGGRLYGRGTADMKGAVAASMLAFRDAALGGGSDGPAGALVFASFVGEEVGGEGARAAIDDGFAPAYAVVGEGSTNYSGGDVTDVAVAHKGRRGSTLTARGAAAHASEPDSGENAVYRACDAVDVVRELDFPEAEVFGERLRGSVAVTEIDGGSAWNVIPEACEVTVDERTVPGERVALERTEDVPGVEWTVDQDLPPMACEDEAFAEAVLDAAAAAQASDPELVTKPHATDAGWLAAAGTACVVCGAAEPGEAHTATESVSVDAVERCYRIYRGAAERWVAP
jgi:acetylornithine deacetylase